MAKAKPIKDMNGEQWTRFQGRVIRAIKQGDDGKDYDLAVEILDRMFGRINKDGNLNPPSGGYTSDLLGHAEKEVALRREQIGRGDV